MGNHDVFGKGIETPIFLHRQPCVLVGDDAAAFQAPEEALEGLEEEGETQHEEGGQCQERGECFRPLCGVFRVQNRRSDDGKGQEGEDAADQR